MKKLLPGFFDGWTKTRFPEGKRRALRLESYEATFDLSTVARLINRLTPQHDIPGTKILLTGIPHF